jgi:hypothetical protein
MLTAQIENYMELYYLLQQINIPYLGVHTIVVKPANPVT